MEAWPLAISHRLCSALSKVAMCPGQPRQQPRRFLRAGLFGLPNADARLIRLRTRNATPQQAPAPRNETRSVPKKYGLRGTRPPGMMRLRGQSERALSLECWPLPVSSEFLKPSFATLALWWWGNEETLRQCRNS